MRSGILTRLRADTTLMTPLTGGLYDGAVVGHISRQTTAAAFDANKELLPCGLVRLPSVVPTGPAYTSARVEITIYLYQPAPGAATIEAARARVFVLLNRVRVAPTSGGAWEIRHATDVCDLDDETIQASLVICRFNAWIIR